MKLGLFIDYDNLQTNHKFSGILDVATKALLQIPLSTVETRGACDVRVYGGWYESSSMTQLAQKLSGAIQQEFPAIVKVPVGSDNIISLTTNAELACALLEEPNHHLFDTYRKKGRPANIRVQEPAAVGCVEPNCLLPMAKKLLRHGKCPVTTCAVAAGDLVYRHEQKIVDTMLTCDFIYASNLGYDRLLLVSGDDDFLPPVRTALLRGSQIIRFHPKPNCRRASFPARGATLIELDL